MGFLDDPVTADFASRNELEEEEEAAIINEFSKQYKVKPSVDASKTMQGFPLNFL